MSKLVMIDDVAYVAPTYVVRLPYGWQVRVPGTRTVSFADSTYGFNVKASLGAAVQYRNAIKPHGAERKERSDKDVSTGIPGVMLSISPPRGRRPEQVSLQIKVRGVDIRRMYVGTLNTYQARLQSKLETVKHLAKLAADRHHQHV